MAVLIWVIGPIIAFLVIGLIAALAKGWLLASPGKLLSDGFHHAWRMLRRIAG